MSRTRWVTSAFLVWHLTALGLASVPSPEKLRPVNPPRHPTDDAIAAQLTPIFDTAAAIVARLCGGIWQAIGPIRRPAALYVSATGLEERWNMFANPPPIDEYLRIRYYVGPAVSHGSRTPTWVATELVYPAHREDQVRIVRSYWQKHRDKAVSIALDGFYVRRDPHLIQPNTRPEDLPDNLAPIGRYFARRFERDHLLQNERVVRNEIWRGRAANLPRRTPENAGRHEARLATLRRYYDGPIEHPLPRVTSYPPYHAGEREGDIEWVLEYFEER